MEGTNIRDSRCSVLCCSQQRSTSIVTLTQFASAVITPTKCSHTHCRKKWRLTDRHWYVSLWRDPDDVPHCQILSSNKTEWRFISATLFGWRRCFVANQLRFTTCIRHGLECAAWRPPRPVTQCRQFPEDAKNASVSECTWTLSALEALRNALYKFKTYLLTYLLTKTNTPKCNTAHYQSHHKMFGS